MDVRKQRPIEKIRAKLIELDLPFTVSFDSINYTVKDEQFKTIIAGRFDTVMIWLRDNGAGLKAKDASTKTGDLLDDDFWERYYKAHPEPTELEQLNEMVKEFGLPYTAINAIYVPGCYSVYQGNIHLFTDEFDIVMQWIKEQATPSVPKLVKTELEAMPLMYDVEVANRCQLYDKTIIKMPVIPRSGEFLSYYARYKSDNRIYERCCTVEYVAHHYNEDGSCEKIKVVVN